MFSDGILLLTLSVSFYFRTLHLINTIFTGILTPPFLITNFFQFTFFLIINKTNDYNNKIWTSNNNNNIAGVE